SVRCARTGIDGILYFATGTKKLLDFQKGVVNNLGLRRRLKSYGGQPVQEVLDLINKWEQLIQ
ncbi:MAG TPA: hypothetical protein VMX17_09540, partial [Candidatus Glassbacteria bacterium]|nr:hypothetical protein [Candidatus Glassbacteria bacterium]